MLCRASVGVLVKQRILTLPLPRRHGAPPRVRTFSGIALLKRSRSSPHSPAANVITCQSSCYQERTPRSHWCKNGAIFSATLVKFWCRNSATLSGKSLFFRSNVAPSSTGQTVGLCSTGMKSDAKNFAESSQNSTNRHRKARLSPPASNWRVRPSTLGQFSL